MVLPTKIPVACVGVLTNLGHALEFSIRALARFRGWDAWLPWQELPSADSQTMAPPGPATVSEPSSSLKPGECPPWLLPLNAHVAGWRHEPLPRVPVPTTLPTWPLELWAPLHAGPLCYAGPSWALGLPRPTSPVPGVPTLRYSPFAATLPARQQDSCTPPNGFRAYIRTNSKTTSILSIWLTH